MKILVAPDSFKGSISAVRACEIIEEGIHIVYPKAEIIKLPIADGGEGTVDSFFAATSCKRISTCVIGPHGRKVEAEFAVLNDNTAVIEMAAASGLILLSENEKNPLKTTSFGTGELIKAAIQYGCKKIIIGLGGSATNDGGVGMLQALGFSFTDKNGEELGFGGGELSRLAYINYNSKENNLDNCEIIVACDVNNTLLGKNGASAVFGPQKGASEADCKQLDKNLECYADIIRETLGKDIRGIPGTGAAGGLAAGLIAFCNAKIKSGIEVILDAVDFDKYLSSVDLIITGEGKIDYQTAHGKVPMGVAKRAKKKGVPVIAIVGTIGEGTDILYDLGLDSIYSIINKPMDLNCAIENVEELLRDGVVRLLKIIKIGGQLKHNN